MTDAQKEIINLLGDIKAAQGGGAVGVTSVSGTAPIASSGGATPAISIDPATPSDPGSMSAADKTKLDGLRGGYSTTVTDDGITTLTAASNRIQRASGFATQTFELPVTSTLYQGFDFLFINRSTGEITLTSSGGNTVLVVPSGAMAVAICVSTSGTSAASWASEQISDYAPLSSPAFTDNPTAPTKAPGDNSTKLATTEYVDAEDVAIKQSILIAIYVKSVAVLTTGAPADIATISIPLHVGRWRLAGGNTVGTAGGTIVAENIAGTLADASFTAFDAANGSGLALTAAVAGPPNSGAGLGWQMVSAANISTSVTIHIRQTADSVNTGTVSFYLLIQPLF